MSELRTLHLFAGAGGGLLADLILGHRPVAAVEWDAHCCAVLRERAADGWFPGLHVHEGDVRLFNPSRYAGRVDCVSAGFPCQDISVAGRGAGIEGERSGLWTEVRFCAGVLRPRFVWLENSPAITARGLGVVLRDLSRLGYDARWCVLPAAATGAPHLRARWFCLARRADTDGQQLWELPRRRGGTGGTAKSSESADDGAQRLVTDTDGESRGRQGNSIAFRGTGEIQQRAPESGRCGEPLADADIERRAGQQRTSWPREASTTGGRGQVRDAARAGLEERQGQCGDEGGQQPAAVGAGWWATEPDVGRVAHGVAARVDRLRAIGNGQVPLQVALAWRMLGGPE